MSQGDFIDLTTLSSPTTDESCPSSSQYSGRTSRYINLTDDSPAPKRQRLDLPLAAGSSRRSPPVQNIDSSDIESVDLTEVNDPASLSQALSKQREDAVKAQHSASDETGRSSLTSYKCPVCMDTPVDATATICGHLFCHKCIIDTIRFGEERRFYENKSSRGHCPVCRKVLTRADTPGPRRNLVPIQLKLMTKAKRRT